MRNNESMLGKRQFSRIMEDPTIQLGLTIGDFALGLSADAYYLWAFMHTLEKHETPSFGELCLFSPIHDGQRVEAALEELGKEGLLQMNVETRNVGVYTFADKDE